MTNFETNRLCAGLARRLPVVALIATFLASFSANAAIDGVPGQTFNRKRGLYLHR